MIDFAQKTIYNICMNLEMIRTRFQVAGWKFREAEGDILAAGHGPTPAPTDTLAGSTGAGPWQPPPGTRLGSADGADQAEEEVPAAAP